MTFTQLEIFVLVAELRGFTAAAMRLSISQSAVSHAIKALEQEMGVGLIQRHQAAIELTDIGAQLVLRAREILGLGETMRQEAADARGLKRGTLRIGSFGPTSSLRLLPKILAEYRKAYPGIEVRIDEGADLEVIQWLQDRRVDIGFVVLPEDRFDTVPIAEDQLVALLPSAHPLAGQPDVKLEALCDAPFILTQAGSAALVERIFAAAKLVPKIRYRSAQLISTLGMVERGDGVTIVAELALPEVDSDRPAAYVARPLNPPVPRSIGLAVHNQRQASPATQAFIEIAIRLQRQGLLSGAGRVK